MINAKEAQMVKEDYELDVEKFLAKVDAKVQQKKGCRDSLIFEVPYNAKAIKEIRNTLHNHGYKTECESPNATQFGKHWATLFITWENGSL